MPVCKVDSMTCKADLERDNVKMFVLNLPALIISTIIISEIGFSLEKDMVRLAHIHTYIYVCVCVCVMCVYDSRSRRIWCGWNPCVMHTSTIITERAYTFVCVCGYFRAPHKTHTCRHVL